MAFQIVESEAIYHGKVFAVRRDRVRLPNGHQATIDVVVHGGAVVLLPVDTEGQVWFVRQYRHAVQRDLLELPAGTLDENEAPEACARREVREEIGMSAENILRIGGYFLAPGYSTEFLHIYLATGLRPDPLEADADEFLSIEKVPLEQAYRWVEIGQIEDAKTLATLILARPHLISQGLLKS